MYTYLVIAVAWGVLVAATGAFLTDSRSTWYREQLKKPSWQPPDWAFGPAWSVIFALAGWSLYLGLRDAPNEDTRLLVLGLFVLNGLANIVWSPLFFTLRRPDWALMEVPVLWLSVLAPMVVLWPISETAGWLLVPYLCWVSFAAYLNRTVVRINPPFGMRAAPAWDSH
nr:TspO/MBR family protein [uncultured Rhodopila sp.]